MHRFTERCPPARLTKPHTPPPALFVASARRQLLEDWTLEVNTKRKVVWSTNSAKHVAALASFQTLKRIMGYMSLKGYKPRSARQVRSILMLAPPAWFTWTRAPDSVVSAHLFANMAILNRHCRLTLTEAHPVKGRNVRAFEGYSERAEDKLLAFARKQLKGLVEKRGRQHFDSGLLLALELSNGISFTTDEVEMKAAVGA